MSNYPTFNGLGTSWLSSDGLYRNGFHQRNNDFEEDEYDEYNDEGLEGEEEEGEEEHKEEERKPSKEELDFLKLREKRKEMFRQKLKKQIAQDFGQSVQSQDSKRTSGNAKFGSFFGPSHPVIASRVLDESRSIRETHHIISKRANISTNERVCTSTSSERKLTEHHQQPKNNEAKRKAQTLKGMRDYSFLLSDDVDLPENSEPQPAIRHVSAHNPDARAIQEDLKSKIPISRPLKSAANGHALKNATQISRPGQAKVPLKGANVSKHLPSLSEHKKIACAIDHNRSSVSKFVPKPVPKPAPYKASAQSNVPVEVMGTNKQSSKAINGLVSQRYKSVVKPYSSSQNDHVEHKRSSQTMDKVRASSKPAQSSIKSEASISSHNIHIESQKKRPAKRRLDEDGGDAIQMIRNMFGYNPSRYAGVDDDDSDMEADFSQIEKEERRSSHLARREDEEQLRLIEEEERRERMRKKHKENKR